MVVAVGPGERCLLDQQRQGIERDVAHEHADHRPADPAAGHQIPITAPVAGTEAPPAPALRVDDQGRGAPIVVEGAQAHVPPSGAAQMDVATRHLLDGMRVSDALYLLSVHFKPS